MSDEAPAPILQAFEFDGAVVRVILREDEPWWVASDVARVLEIGRTHDAVRGLEDDEKGAEIIRTPGGTQAVAVISEPGLYALMIRSKKPEAKRFRRWVTHEVIPAVRRTGRYCVNSTTPEIAPTPTTYAAALRLLADQVEATAAAEAKAAALEASAQAWEALADTGRDYSVGEAAKILSRDPAIRIGRQRLFAILVELGMVSVEKEGPRRNRTAYKPRQEHVDAGRLTLRIGRLRQNSKTLRWEVGMSQLRITVKGLAYLRKKLRGVAALKLGDFGELRTNSTGVVRAS